MQYHKLANYLLKGFKATRLTTMNQLGIANLTAVISDLRNVIGDDAVHMEIHKDYRGQRYAVYSITPEKVRFLKEKGLVRPIFNGDLMLVA